MALLGNGTVLSGGAPPASLGEEGGVAPLMAGLNLSELAYPLKELKR